MGVLAVLCLTAGAAACGDGSCMRDLSEPETVLAEYDPSAELPVTLLGAPDYAGAIQACREGVWAGQTYIDLTPYGLPYSEETFDILNQSVNYRQPDFFAVSLLSFRGYSIGGTAVLSAMTVDYWMSGEEYTAAKKVYRDGIEAITDQIDPDWSTIEKLLFVHDYLAANYEYDLTYSNYDALSFFQQKTGVCQAYTMAFMAVMNELGIENSYLESHDLDHIWNLVKVGNNWYHIDVTWDDPITDRLGCARHTFFLLSDDASKVKHDNDDGDDWIFGNGVSCTDTTYDNYFWTSVWAPFLNVDGTWYTVNSSGLTTWDGTSAAFGPVLDHLYASCSGLAYSNGKLYYNSSSQIRSYDLFTQTASPVLTFSHSGGSNGQGLLVNGDILTYQCYRYVDVKDPETGAVLGQQMQAVHDTLTLSPYAQSAGNDFSYYVSNGTVHIQQNTPSTAVAVVCFNEHGRMVDHSLLTASGSYRLKQGGSVKLIAMDTAGGWLPCGAPVTGTVK